jgi:hypothetical protein
MALRTDKAAPGALAADLARAKDRLNAAEARYQSEKQAVIQRGSQRVEHIVALQKELAQEQADIQSVIAKV